MVGPWPRCRQEGWPWQRAWSRWPWVRWCWRSSYPVALAGAFLAGCWAAGMAEQAAAEGEEIGIGRGRIRKRPRGSKRQPNSYVLYLYV